MVALEKCGTKADRREVEELVGAYARKVAMSHNIDSKALGDALYGPHRLASAADKVYV